MNTITVDTGRRSPTRWLAAIVIPIGPAAVALLRYLLPYNTTDDTATIVAKVIADPGRQSMVLWLGFLAALTLVPGAFWVATLTRRQAPRLTMVALLLLVPGYLSLAWMTASDLLIWTGAQAGLDQATLTRLADTVHPTTSIAEGLFVAGHVLGTVLLGLAMWASTAIPRWAATVTIISQPLHFVAAVFLANHPLDLAAWTMQAVGFAAAAYLLATGSRSRGPVSGMR
jgi:hypothetical protein